MKEVGNWYKPLGSIEADVICLQETKITRDQLDENTALEEGFNSYFAFSRKRSGYSGVATFCRDSFTPCRAEEGLAGTLPSSNFKDSIGHYGQIENEFSWGERKELDSEGRSVLTQHEVQINGSIRSLVIINVYCPALTHADEDKHEERKQFKLKFNKLLELRANALLDAGFHVIILGDINISHKRIDHCNPSEDFDNNPGRQWLNHFLYSNLLPQKESIKIDKSKESKNSQPDDLLEWKLIYAKTKSNQFVDAFREKFPNITSAYTCWNTELNCRSTNYGTRIDYIFIDLNLYKTGVLNHCDIKPEILGSDHCPVFAELGFNLISSPKCPWYCTKNFPEFLGTQQKLSKFFRNETNCYTAKNTSNPDNFKNNQGEAIDLKKKSGLLNLGHQQIENKSSKSKPKKPNQRNIKSYFIKTNNDSSLSTSTIHTEKEESSVCSQDTNKDNALKSRSI